MTVCVASGGQHPGITGEAALSACARTPRELIAQVIFRGLGCLLCNDGLRCHEPSDLALPVDEYRGNSPPRSKAPAPCGAPGLERRGQLGHIGDGQLRRVSGAQSAAAGLD
jgi:hypothetical protein